MIEIEIAPIKNLSAVLASVLVALEDVVTRKLHFLFREPIESTITRGTRIFHEIVVTISCSGAAVEKSRQLSKSCVMKLLASSDETTWACPA